MPLLWGNAERIFNLPVVLDSFLVVAALHYSKGILFFGARATLAVAPTLDAFILARWYFLLAISHSLL